jgi:cellulose synthase (UDP-forming)
LVDAIAHIGPFIIAQVAVLLWLTEGRILPIMSDLYGTLCATEVVKAFAAGILRPNGHKFRVTAKGGDRSKRIVQWPVLRIFLFYLAVNAFGIVNAFVFSRSGALTDIGVMALFWSWYNIIILVLACYVCIEQPQRRYRHRFPTNELVQLEAENCVQQFVARDISVSGMRLNGAAPVEIGGSVNLVIGGFTVKARLVRLTKDGFALAFNPTLRNRAIVIRHIFSKRIAMTERSIKPGKVALAITARLLR